MSRYKAYPAYKGSGVDWLGLVPMEWFVSKIAYIFLKSNAGEVIDKNYWGSGKETLYTCNKTPLLSDFQNFPEEKRTESNDLLLTRNGTPYVHKPKKNSIYSNVVQRISLVDKFDRDFLAYCLGNSAPNLTGYGVSIESLNFENWKLLPFAYPTKVDQTRIAAFLDHETAKIDALIEKQQRLIELLKEKRQAVISHAVTKGLNPKAPMKDSGVEWLGEVPAHWEVMRLKHLAVNIKAGPFGSTITKDMYVSAGYRVYGQEQVIPENFSLGDYYISPETFLELSQYEVTSGDILISCVGTFGKIAVVPPWIEPGIINPRLIRFRCNEHVAPSLLAIILRSAVVFEQFAYLSRGGTMDVINIGTLSEINVVVPPREEQAELVERVNCDSARFDALTKEAETATALLKERRTALISAAVTGKIDVRDWQPAAA